MKNLALLFLTSILTLVLTSENAIAALDKTLVIFDIDDTIKISHVLDTVDAIGIAPQTSTDVAFPQMSDLANAIKRDHKNVEFHYVSNAPLPMEAAHALFLYRNDFPADGLHMNTYMTPGNSHKISTITQIIEETHPTKLLMIGDNGERDVEVYDYISQRYSGKIVSSTYIHMLYNENAGGKQLRLFQRGFVNAKQLALDLANEGWLTEASARQILANKVVETDAYLIPRNTYLISFSSINGISNAQVDLLRLGLPIWADCSMFDSNYWMSILFENNADFIQLKNRINRACSVR